MSGPILHKRVGYLSAAPRVSTRPETEQSGPRTHVLGIIRGFETLGWEVKPFIVGDHVPHSWIKEGSEKKITSTKLKRLVADIIRLAMGPINTVRAYKEVGDDVDCVYERHAVLQSLGWLFKRRGKMWILETNAPLSIEAGSDRKAIALSPVARYMEKKAYQNCDYLICVSETLKEIILEKFLIDEKKIIAIPNGVDTVVFDPENVYPRRFFDGFTIGYVGSFANWQGLDILLRAINSLKKQGLEIFLVLVGDGPKRADLEILASELGIRNQVEFVGLVPLMDVPAFIAGFDAGYAGHIETASQRIYFSPLKIYEYLAMAKPVIASAHQETRSLITDGLGVLFQPGNQQDLERAISELHLVQDKLPDWGKLARNEIVSKHSWTARVRQILDHIFEEVEYM